MAWHDSDWNGHICRKPEENKYCIGTHSLFSGRIEKKRDLEFELENHGKPVCKSSTGEIPPCYWSINAFGQNQINVVHTHAFSWLNIDDIPDVLDPNSVYTWPFKLSFVHETKAKKKAGNYPPDLEDRIDRFTSKFTPGESIVFFYANYDNPVSADDMRYLLLGCSVITHPLKHTRFKFTKDRINEIRGLSTAMKNFPTINWALQVTHDPEQTVLLPYRQYIAHVDANPDDEDLLKDIRVIIEEDSLVSGFKYVAMDIDDDKCLYLLYKLRKAIKKMQDHKRSVVDSTFEEEDKRVTALIKKAWEKRGIYPSLPTILKRFLPDEDCVELAVDLEQATGPRHDLQMLLEEIIDDEEVPKPLEEHEDVLLDLVNTHSFKVNVRTLAKLSLFNLTTLQIKKILDNAAILKVVPGNPYVLFEEYVADDNAYLDDPDLVNEPIDLYKIDVGLIPDRKFVKRHRDLQNLMEDSPHRIRAVFADYLRRIGQVGGHCYDHGERSDHKSPRQDFTAHIDESVAKLLKKIPDFDEVTFRDERGKLYAYVLAKSLYLLTGRPGSGKTFEVSKIIETLLDGGEKVTVLAPTGKAALRLSQNIAANAKKNLKADTIDRFLYKNDFGWAYEDWDALDSLPDHKKLTVENLVIDESSMIDLEKLRTLLGAIRIDDDLPRRIILVGDENQLPPIGFGKPFHDMITYIQDQNDLEPCHYVNLRSNCRQENDPKILQLAEVFTDKKRYYITFGY